MRAEPAAVLVLRLDGDAMGAGPQPRRKRRPPHMGGWHGTDPWLLHRSVLRIETRDQGVADRRPLHGNCLWSCCCNLVAHARRWPAVEDIDDELMLVEIGP